MPLLQERARLGMRSVLKSLAGSTAVLVQMLPARAQVGMRSVQHFAGSGQKRYNEKETAAFMLPAA